MNIEIRDSDNYVNITTLCKLGGKSYKHWKETKKSKLFIDLLSQETGISTEKLIDYQKGRGATQKTWGHPRIALNIAQWISTDFEVNVSRWIEDWKNHSVKNQLEYKFQLLNIKSDEGENRERQIQIELQKKLGGEIEVETKYGYIDLLTDDSIIEIKNFKLWKQAFGQIMMYANFYPDKQKVICLFDVKDFDLLSDIEKEYSKYSIKLLSEPNL